MGADGVRQNLFIEGDIVKGADSMVNLSVQLSVRPEHIVRATVESLGTPGVSWGDGQHFIAATIRIWRARKVARASAMPYVATAEVSADSSADDSAPPDGRGKRQRLTVPVTDHENGKTDDTSTEGKEEKVQGAGSGSGTGAGGGMETKLPGMWLSVEPEAVEDWTVSASGVELNRYTTIPGLGASLHRFWYLNETDDSVRCANDKALANFRATRKAELKAELKAVGGESTEAEIDDAFFAQPHIGFRRSQWRTLNPDCLVSWMRTVARQSNGSVRIMWDGYCDFVAKNHPAFNRPAILVCVAFALLQCSGVKISKKDGRYLRDGDVGLFSILTRLLDPDDDSWFGGGELSHGIMEWLHDSCPGCRLV